MDSKTFEVKGMHCASCSNIIRRKLSKLPGVETCEVNYATEKAKVTYDPQIVSIDTMNKEIGKVGYSLVDHSKMDHSTHLGLNQTKEDKARELNQQKKYIFTLIPMMIISAFVMFWEIGAEPLGLWLKMPEVTMEFFHHLLPLLATYAMFVVGIPYLKGVLHFIRHGAANMDTLVGIGTLSAYVYSFFVTAFEAVLMPYINVEQVYYDVTIIVIGFITLGKYLEARSKIKTGAAIEKLLGLQAKTALVLRGDQEVEIPLDEVQIGDTVVIKPGAKIPVDGIILEGTSSIDESMINGEPLPVDKKTGDYVIGSTINKQGHFSFKATKVGSETMLAQIVKMVEEAQGSRAPIQGLADKISAVFVPVVLVIAFTSLFFWIIVGNISFGILCFVGVLIIACPCALGLATPTAIIVGVGKGAENGILIKDAESLEKLQGIKTIVLDKTGTLTKGKPQVAEVIVTDSELTDADLLQIAASIEIKSEHPLAQAIVESAKSKNIGFVKVEHFKAIEGVGVEAVVEDKHISIKKPSLEERNTQIIELQKQGKTVVIIKSEGKMIGFIAISDTIKEGALNVIDKLHSQGIKVVMLTGDNKEAANYIAQQVHIDEVIAEVLPQDKAQKIKELQKEGHLVAMVGDGVNDAPALTQADVGMAMATGTDVAIESADVILLHGDISKVSQAIVLSRATVATIKQNLFWAFIYNVVGIPLAAGLFYPLWGVLLNPAFAGLAMAGSSVSVVLNSLRLQRLPVRMK